MHSQSAYHALSSTFIPLAEQIRNRLMGEIFTSFGEGSETILSEPTIDRQAPLNVLERLFGGFLPNYSTAEFEISTGLPIEDLEGISSFSNNVIGNNAAILLTDNAESVVNFLYINPIEFFNSGRPSDIYLDISLSGETASTAQSEGEVFVDDASNSLPLDPSSNDEQPGSTASMFAEPQPKETPPTAEDTPALKDYDPELANAPDATVVNDNVISNNAAILLTDNAQSKVNFLYINPIEFFNNGRGSDIHIDISLGEDAKAQAAGVQQGKSLNPIESNADNAQNQATLDSFDFEEVSRTDRVQIDEDLSITAVQDNLIGNNAAVLLTDNAQSTVNFLYVNPIEFFNNGRGGDIHLNISMGADDAFHIL